MSTSHEKTERNDGLHDYKTETKHIVRDMEKHHEVGGHDHHHNIYGKHAAGHKKFHEHVEHVHKHQE